MGDVGRPKLASTFFRNGTAAFGSHPRCSPQTAHLNP
jgi:hypothetical protein